MMLHTIISPEEIRAINTHLVKVINDIIGFITVNTHSYHLQYVVTYVSVVNCHFIQT